MAVLENIRVWAVVFIRGALGNVSAEGGKGGRRKKGGGR